MSIQFEKKIAGRFRHGREPLWENPGFEATEVKDAAPLNGGKQNAKPEGVKFDDRMWSEKVVRTIRAT